MNTDKKYHRGGAEITENKNIKTYSLRALCVSAVDIVFHLCSIRG